MKASSGKKMIFAAVMIPLFLLLFLAVIVTSLTAEGSSGSKNFDMEDLPEILTAEMIAGAMVS